MGRFLEFERVLRPLTGLLPRPGAECCRGRAAFSVAPEVGLAIAPALQVATIPLAVVGGAFLARAWYLQIGHGVRGVWPLRSLATLAVSTTVAATPWGLRFGGILGG